MRQRRRSAQRGIVRGCCLGVLVLLAGSVLLVVLALKATAAPDLGAAPAGPSHGSSEVQIAVALGGQLAAELASNPQAVVTLSEQDLTVLAEQNRPSRFASLQARVRGGDIVVSGPTSEGPLTVTAVAYVSISLDTTQSPPQFAASVTRLDVGQISLPGFVRDLLLHDAAPSINIDNLFAQAALRALQANVDCLRVTAQGVTIGVHRPGAGADPAVCGA